MGRNLPRVLVKKRPHVREDGRLGPLWEAIVGELESQRQHPGQLPAGRGQNGDCSLPAKPQPFAEARCPGLPANSFILVLRPADT